MIQCRQPTSNILCISVGGRWHCRHHYRHGDEARRLGLFQLGGREHGGRGRGRVGLGPERQWVVEEQKVWHKTAFFFCLRVYARKKVVRPPSTLPTHTFTSRCLTKAFITILPMFGHFAKNNTDTIPEEDSHHQIIVIMQHVLFKI